MIPPPRTLVKLAIAQHLCQHILDCQILADQFHGGGRTDPGAMAAIVTAYPVNSFSAGQVDGSTRASWLAIAATYTFFGEESQLPVRFNRFRVFAPATAHRATLQKHDRSDAGTIMDGIPLDIKHLAGDLSSHFNPLSFTLG